MFSQVGCKSNAFRCMFVTCGFAVLFAAQAHAQVTFRTVVAPGMAAPGTDPGVVISAVHGLAITRDGHVAFKGVLSGPGVDVSNSVCLYAERGGSLNLVARRGSPAPGAAPGATFHDLGGFRYDNQGSMLFDAQLKQSSGLPWPQSVWIDRDGTPVMLAREGDPATGVSANHVYSYFFRPTLNHENVAMFIATTRAQPTGSGRGLWRTDGGALSLVLHSTEPAPGTTDLFPIVGNGPALNDNLQLAFLGGVHEDGATPPDQNAIWSDRSGTLEMLYRQTDPAPGMSPTTKLGTLGFTSVNRHGSVAFATWLSGPEINNDNQASIWSDHDGGLRLLAREGEAAPVAGQTLMFCNFLNPVINDLGITAIRATASDDCFSGTPVDGIWLEHEGFLANVVHTQQSAPDESAGVTFSGIALPTINNRSQIAFGGQVTGPGIDDSNKQGLWVANPDGEIVKVLRTGAMFDIDDSPESEDLRVIESFDVLASWSTSDGRENSFNDVGELAFSLRFTDGTYGAVVARIPAPDICLSGLGDMNTDGAVNGLDIGGFIECVSIPGLDHCRCADFDGNDEIDLSDLNAFTNLLVAM